MKKIILPLAMLMLMMMAVSGCGKQEETPEDALNEIKAAIDRYDYEKFSARVDVRSLLDNAYDDATLELASRVNDFSAAYPDDPFFRNRGEDIVLYNEFNRDEHMKFVREVVTDCFDRQLTAPEKFSEDTIVGTAAELRHYYSTASSTVESSTVVQNRATLRLNVKFESRYAGGTYSLPLRLEFEKDGEHWKLMRVSNVEEMIMPLVDIAEILWPDQFNF